MKLQTSLQIWSIAGLSLAGGFLGGLLGASAIGGNEIHKCTDDFERGMTERWEGFGVALQNLDGHLYSLAEDISKLNGIDSIQRQNVPQTPTLRKEEAVQEEWQGALESPSWPGVLPRIISRELVLRGLTPYDDPRIAALAREACRAFELLDKETRRMGSKLYEENSIGLIAYDDFMRLANENVSKQQEGREEIVQHLGNGLDAYIE